MIPGASIEHLLNKYFLVWVFELNRHDIVSERSDRLTAEIKSSA